ncbi:3-hydroxyisobutyryl-CoA hydrolase mitochondrial [Biomphalaria pfeifferi]|uniref:3-hydroxyisobutyryl-CoA hydrolase, mitochondrial n=1 Tax=Biomphalaria pfeifferi TaxID=112525 RepID=A0AAD8BAG4_BIOPF|nr:3-hydroxyisobutyryl-CoA hydrolase mitochondrial [Biomphalaria pfeifferi]
MLPRSLIRLRVVISHLRMAQMSTKSGEEILFQTVNNTGVITLNRPKALNALNLSMVRKMYAQMLRWEEDPSIGLVLIKGEGEKSFCAGGDIRAVTEAGRKGDQLAQDFFREEYILNHKIGVYKKPYVALIDGITMGGGVGLFPDVGGGHFLPRLDGKLGIFLALTGFRLKGRDVKHIGIATHFIDSMQINELEKQLTSLRSDAGQDGVAAVLSRLNSESTLDTDKDLVLKPHLEKINKLFAGQTMEKIFDNLQNDKSDWAKKQLDILKKMSPTSLKITLRLLLEGKTRSLAEDLTVEYRLSQRCLEDRDFYEGVRAVLIDKDNNPQWNPASIKDVSNSKVDWFFSPLDPKKELVL